MHQDKGNVLSIIDGCFNVFNCPALYIHRIKTCIDLMYSEGSHDLPALFFPF